MEIVTQATMPVPQPFLLLWLESTLWGLNKQDNLFYCYLTVLTLSLFLVWLFVFIFVHKCYNMHVMIMTGKSKHRKKIKYFLITKI